MERIRELCCDLPVPFPDELWLLIASSNVKCAATLSRLCHSLRRLAYPLVQTYKEPFETLTKCNSRLDFRFLNYFAKGVTVTRRSLTFNNQVSGVLYKGNEVDLCIFRFNECVRPVQIRLSIMCANSQTAQSYLALFCDGQREDTLFLSTVVHLLNYARHNFPCHSSFHKYCDIGYESFLTGIALQPKHDAKREINPLLY